MEDALGRYEQRWRNFGASHPDGTPCPKLTMLPVHLSNLRNVPRARQSKNPFQISLLTPNTEKPPSAASAILQQFGEEELSTRFLHVRQLRTQSAKPTIPRVWRIPTPKLPSPLPASPSSSPEPARTPLSVREQRREFRIPSVRPLTHITSASPRAVEPLLAPEYGFYRAAPAACAVSTGSLLEALEAAERTGAQLSPRGHN
eukprot:gnl/Chilomastix_cuspidata/3022.p2 GENE.gnl/Chilomastix_cuspidata/3022~~gnl/Chilomastix_cuspidata/3022.p2  ORF type:complete len:202 (-),score=39.64 gnl/Chilomastix_cuspidata/3022:27-632(-)